MKIYQYLYKHLKTIFSTFVLYILYVHKYQTRLSDNELLNYINHGIININRNTRNRKYPLLCAICSGDINIIQLLIEYADANNIILELNEIGRYKYEYNPFLNAIYRGDIEIIKLLITYANKSNIILALNKKDHFGNYPLLIAIYSNNNVEIVNLLMDYASKNNIILALNEKGEDGYYPLLSAINNDIEIINNIVIIADIVLLIINFIIITPYPSIILFAQLLLFETATTRATDPKAIVHNISDT